jgi:phosphoglycerate dehydrogenase-like enzyme/transposase
VITAANVHDSRVLEEVLDAIPPIRGLQGRPRKRPAKRHADKGYDYPRCRTACRMRGITPRIARRDSEASERLGRHRWVVERTLAWLARFRRLTVRYERRAAIHRAFLVLACALVCWHRIHDRFCNALLVERAALPRGGCLSDTAVLRSVDSVQSFVGECRTVAARPMYMRAVRTTRMSGSDTVTVAVIASVSDDALLRIAAVDPRITVVDARRWFDGEIAETWPPFAVQRYLGAGRGAGPHSSREERDRLLASAEVILGGFPFPLDLRARAPLLRWFHQTPAGASNLLRGDLWGSDVLVTTSRGQEDTRQPYAEYVLGSLLHFARGFPHAYSDQRRRTFTAPAYRPILLQGKTVCVVGAGGIGQAVGRLCAAAGMRVVGTRRRVAPGEPLPHGFSRLEDAPHLHELLRESDCVAVCCQWTPETTNLISTDAFAAMKPGTILVNVARGEIIDEAALVDALAAGKLRGVALDVYVGEFEHAPDRRLWDDARVLITPHISGGTDAPQQRPVDLFCDNLRAYLDRQPLVNVIDWERGY